MQQQKYSPIHSTPQSSFNLRGLACGACLLCVLVVGTLAIVLPIVLSRHQTPPPNTTEAQNNSEFPDIYNYLNDTLILTIQKTSNNQSHFTISGYFYSLTIYVVDDTTSNWETFDNSENVNSIINFIYDFNGTQYTASPYQGEGSALFLRISNEQSGERVCLYFYVNPEHFLQQQVNPHPLLSRRLLGMNHVPKLPNQHKIQSKQDHQILGHALDTTRTHVKPHDASYALANSAIPKARLLTHILRSPTSTKEETEKEQAARHLMTPSSDLDIVFFILSALPLDPRGTNIPMLTYDFAFPLYPNLDTCLDFCSNHHCQNFSLQDNQLWLAEYNGTDIVNNASDTIYYCNVDRSSHHCARLCGSNNGPCQHNSLYCPLPFSNAECTSSGEGVNGLQCNCTTGWGGVTCEDDINECASTPPVCAPHGATCENNPGSYECTCNQGWTGDGTSCVFELTCNQASGATLGAEGCVCHNQTDRAQNHIYTILGLDLETCIWGQFPNGEDSCACGYELDEDLHFCPDVDECQALADMYGEAFAQNVSMFRCENTIGSFLIPTESGENQHVGCWNPGEFEFSVGNLNSPWCCDNYLHVEGAINHSVSMPWGGSGCLCGPGYTVLDSGYYACSECSPDLDQSSRCLCVNVTYFNSPLSLGQPDDCELETAYLPLVQCYCDNGNLGGDGQGSCIPNQEAPCPPNSHPMDDACVCNDNYYPQSVTVDENEQVNLCCACGLDSNLGNCIPIQDCEAPSCPCDSQWDWGTMECQSLGSDICELLGMSDGVYINGVGCSYNQDTNEIDWICSDGSKQAQWFDWQNDGEAWIILWCCDLDTSTVGSNSSDWVGYCLCNDLTLSATQANATGCSTCVPTSVGDGCSCKTDLSRSVSSLNSDLTCLAGVEVVQTSCTCNGSSLLPTGEQGVRGTYNSWTCFNCEFYSPYMMLDPQVSMCECEDGYTLMENTCLSDNSCEVVGNSLCDPSSTICVDDINGDFSCSCLPHFWPTPNPYVCTLPT